VWAHRDIFKLDRKGQMRVVTGVPPDYFAKDGQRWGNPHYRWDVLKRRRYDWWVLRLRRAFELYDAVRLDHFLGFLRAWEIPAHAHTARKGRFVRGPGAALFRALKRSLGELPLIAEDLGLLTDEAAALRDKLGLPGMRVLQFVFRKDGENRPYYFPRNSVVYTGTHDNNTTKGWFREGGPDRDLALKYAGCRRSEISWGMVRTAHLSPSDLAIVPVQDLLGLGSEARMNRPGVADGNWTWRVRRGQLTPALARKLRELTHCAGRCS